jgi:hypothetical protein
MKMILILSMMLSQSVSAQNMNLHDWMMRMQQSLVCLSYPNLLGCKDDKTMLTQFKDAAQHSEEITLQFPKFQQDPQKLAQAKGLFTKLNADLDQLGQVDKSARGAILEDIQNIMSQGHRL